MASGEELARRQGVRQPARKHTLPSLIKVPGRSPGVAMGLSLLVMTKVGSTVVLVVVVAALAVSMLLRQRQSFHAGDAKVILIQVNGQSWGQKSKGAQVGLS